MISEHSAHLTPLSVDLRTWLWRYTYLLLLISMLWHRQAIFKSKGDKLCSSAECGIWTRDPRHQIASRLNARWQTDWAIEDQGPKMIFLQYDISDIYIYICIYIYALNCSKCGVRYPLASNAVALLETSVSWFHIEDFPVYTTNVVYFFFKRLERENFG